jgi:hypothetical protein
MEPRARRSRNWVVPEQPPERHEGFARVVDQEPVVAHYARNPNSALVRLSDFLSSRQLRNLALYSEHYGPLGRIEDTVPIVWHAEAGIMNAFGLLRHSKFSDKERALMDFLRPHLIQAHANAVAVSKIYRSTTLLQKALEVSARALVVLKHDAPSSMRRNSRVTGCTLTWAPPVARRDFPNHSICGCASTTRQCSRSWSCRVLAIRWSSLATTDA